jgi:hypothetical protein
MVEKNPMTPLFVVAAIVAVPVVLWFLQRGAVQRQNKQEKESGAATNLPDVGSHAGAVDSKTPGPRLATSLPKDAAQLPNTIELFLHAERTLFDAAPRTDDNPLLSETIPPEALAPPEIELAPMPEVMPTATSLYLGQASLRQAEGGPSPNREVLPPVNSSSCNTTELGSVEEAAPRVSPQKPNTAQPTDHSAQPVITGEPPPALKDEKQSVVDDDPSEITSRAAVTTFDMPSEGSVQGDADELPCESEVAQSTEIATVPAASEIRNGRDGIDSEPISLVSTVVGLLPHAEIPTRDEESPSADSLIDALQQSLHGDLESVSSDLPCPDVDVPVAVTFTDAAETYEPNVIEKQYLYRPPPQRAPRRIAQTAIQSTPRSTSDLALEIRVRLKFDRFGFCDIRFLPERKTDMDNEIDVTIGATRLQLVAQEEWYDDLALENTGDRLRRGLELKGRLADEGRARWLLTGRNIYVLANYRRVGGFLSTARLVLGRSHVVLCTAEIGQQVEEALAEAGCQGYAKLDETHGLPSGWIGIREVTPSRAVPLEPGNDPFYSIKPTPDIDLALEGGVCLRNSVWLAGFPPQIKLLGDASMPVKVLIDGQEAVLGADGSLAVDGFDRPGEHLVCCEGLSCSRAYSIESPPDVWEEWSAYQFGEAEICGPLVRILPQAAGRRVFSVPMANPLLLGAEPGQIFRCSPRRVKTWKGFVPFDVVWALPAQPYICDKKTARIIQFSQTPLVLPSPTKHAHGWCAAILEASRKGILIENATSAGGALWKEYRKAARNSWRAAR